MGMLNSESKLAKPHLPQPAGHHRCWYPVALARNLVPGAVLGRDFLGTRVVAYRDESGKPVVQSAWCPHLGADLSVGQIVDGRLRCAYHHWSFDTAGKCANIPTGDKIPSAARIFTYPSAESWGLLWAFNGESADFDVPGIPGADPQTIVHEAHERGRRPWDTWVAVSNGVDFQHLRTLHGLPAASLPERLEVEPNGIEFRVESPHHLQHGRISGTNVFAQHLRIAGNDLFMLFCGTPLEPGSSSGYVVIGVPPGASERLPDVLAMVDRLNEEDAPVLSTMRFRRGLLTASDRHLATYLRYVEAFPRFEPPAL